MRKQCRVLFGLDFLNGACSVTLCICYKARVESSVFRRPGGSPGRGSGAKFLNFIIFLLAESRIRVLKEKQRRSVEHHPVAECFIMRNAIKFLDLAGVIV